jgi:hypothetical protein
MGLMVIDPDCSIGPEDASEANKAQVGREVVLAKGFGANTLEEEPTPDMVSGRMVVSQASVPRLR